METNEDLFEEMIYKFNFYKVREVMRFLDWKWWTNPDDIPTVTEMKEKVYDLYISAKNFSSATGTSSTAESGGFVVTVNRRNKTAILRFCIEESDAGFE